METISNVVNAASRVVWGEGQGQGDASKQPTEPLSGVTGAGKPTDPYDAGNAEENRISQGPAASGQSGSSSPHDPSTRNRGAADDATAAGGSSGPADSSARDGSKLHEGRNYPSNIAGTPVRLHGDPQDEYASSRDIKLDQKTLDNRSASDIEPRTGSGDDNARTTNIAGTPFQTLVDRPDRPHGSRYDAPTQAAERRGTDHSSSALAADHTAPTYIAGTPVRIYDGGQDINSGEHTSDHRAASDIEPRDDGSRGDTSYIAGTPFQVPLSQPDRSAASHDHSSSLFSSERRDEGSLHQPEQLTGGRVTSDQSNIFDGRGSAPSHPSAASHGASSGGYPSAPRLVGQEDNKYGPSGGIAQGGVPQGLNVRDPVRPEQQTDKTGVIGLHSYDPKFSLVEPSSSNEPTRAPVGGFGTVEPSICALPTSGQRPEAQEQGGSRPRDEPNSGESLQAVRETKALDERAADTGGFQGYTNEPAASQVGGDSLLAGVEGPSGGIGTGGGAGYGHKYRSTGLAADGGDFDAAKPGAPEEADRIIQEQGGLPTYKTHGTHSLTAHHSHAHHSHRTHYTHDTHDTRDTHDTHDTHDKTGLGTKLKEKLHIGH